MYRSSPARIVLTEHIDDGVRIDTFVSLEQLLFEVLEQLSEDRFSKFAKMDWPNIKAKRKADKWLKKFPF